MCSFVLVKTCCRNKLYADFFFILQIIPVLMKSEVKNTFGESYFNKAGGSEHGINLQNDPISSQRIKQVLTSYGF